MLDYVNALVFLFCLICLCGLFVTCLCDVVWSVIVCFVVLCVCVPVFLNVCEWFGCHLLCDVVWFCWLCWCVGLMCSCGVCLMYCVMFYGLLLLCVFVVACFV